MTDYTTVPHYFLPPEDASEETLEYAECAAPGCGQKSLETIHLDFIPPTAARPSAEFGDVED